MKSGICRVEMGVIDHNMGSDTSGWSNQWVTDVIEKYKSNNKMMEHVKAATTAELLKLNLQLMGHHTCSRHPWLSESRVKFHLENRAIQGISDSTLADDYGNNNFEDGPAHLRKK
ncbi:hypothetical protein L2E82_45750 [Cichorium intybus]|uniref:Uncharacterized protein n=1 Tax=Cichorium intybus TaxID=13427 RepID=A0ACB8ZTS0_CICIN|nr:hypothetical protein L2E82_45750 [Cichorium intybus]